MARETTVDEVKKLTSLDWSPGTLMPWSAIEEVLAPLTRRDRRFQSILTAFKMHMRKWQNTLVRTKPGLGLYVLHARERAGDVMTTLSRTSFLHQRAATDADTIPIIELAGIDLEHAQHVRVSAHRLRAYAVEEIARWTALPRVPGPTPGPPQRPIALMLATNSQGASPP